MPWVACGNGRLCPEAGPNRRGCGHSVLHPLWRTTQHQGLTPAPWGFSGEWHDAATGLQYLRARWYQPQTGRFTQVDPFPGVLSLPGTQHSYSYGLNNPTRYTDPSGMFIEELVVGTVVGAIGGLAIYAFEVYAEARSCSKANTLDTFSKLWDWGAATQYMFTGAVTVFSIALMTMIPAHFAPILAKHSLSAIFWLRIMSGITSGLAFGVGYALPATYAGDFDSRKFGVTVGIGFIVGYLTINADAGLESSFLARVVPILREAAISESQYTLESIITGEKVTGNGILAALGTGVFMGVISGPASNPTFTRLGYNARPGVHNMSRDLMESTLRGILGDNWTDFVRSTLLEVLLNASSD